MKNSNINMQGCCLCGAIQFEIKKNIEAIYHCHCSLCRKQSGTSCNSATLIRQTDFEWLSDLTLIKTYDKETGFRSSFCLGCGSPVPNQIAKSMWVWIPLGLLEAEITPLKRFNFCMSSKVAWSQYLDATQDYAVLPSWEELQQYFN